MWLELTRLRWHEETKEIKTWVNIDNVTSMEPIKFADRDAVEIWFTGERSIIVAENMSEITNGIAVQMALMGKVSNAAKINFR